jgi:hypothetical protein
VSWIYRLTNTGGDDLEDVVVTDSQGVTVTCGASILAAGAMMDCTASEPAADLSQDPFSGVLGRCGDTSNSRLYQNIGSVTAMTAGETPVSDEDTSHYCNLFEFIFMSGFE